MNHIQWLKLGQISCFDLTFIQIKHANLAI